MAHLRGVLKLHLLLIYHFQALEHLCHLRVKDYLKRLWVLHEQSLQLLLVIGIFLKLQAFLLNLVNLCVALNAFRNLLGEELLLPLLVLHHQYTVESLFDVNCKLEELQAQLMYKQVVGIHSVLGSGRARLTLKHVLNEHGLDFCKVAERNHLVYHLLENAFIFEILHFFHQVHDLV